MGTTEPNSTKLPSREAMIFMPSGGWMDEYYRQLIQPILQEAGYTVRRGKSVYSNSDPKDEIRDPIRQSHVTLCWMTGRDPGVLFALGTAHALGIPLVLITDSASIEDVPIGIRGLNWIEVKQANPGWGKVFCGDLVRALAGISSPPQSMDGILSE